MHLCDVGFIFTYLPYILKLGSGTGCVFWGPRDDKITAIITRSMPPRPRHASRLGSCGEQRQERQLLMGSLRLWPRSGITPAFISASREGPREPGTWSTAWPTTPKSTTAATAMPPWCYSREVTVGKGRGTEEAIQGSSSLPPTGCIGRGAYSGDGQALKAQRSSWTKHALQVIQGNWTG